MCGIIACRTRTPAIEYLLVALRRLEYRGYDSVGVAVQTVGGDVVRLRTVDRIGALDRTVTNWTGPQLDGVGIGHTRWATHGSVTESNAHPHADCTGRIHLVHNGIIENADDLREALTVAGHRFASAVDSEVLSHLIEDELDVTGDLFTAVHAALTAVQGSWAVAVLEKDTGRVVVAAHESPLLIARTTEGVFAASDIAALADWIDEFRVLEDGEVIELDGVSGWHDSTTGTGEPVIARCIWRSHDIDMNGYADHMAKEIDEQPAAAARVIDTLGDQILSGALWSNLGLAPFGRLRVVGCGTSLHAGDVIGNMVRRLGGIPVTLSVASEAAGEIAEPDTLCLAISQSGETADVLQAISSQPIDQPVLGLTNNVHSTLARRSDAVLTCGAGLEIGVAATKTFVCQVITGAALVISALVSMDRLSAPAAVILVDHLRSLPDQLAAAETVAKACVPPLAEELSVATGFLFISRGSGIPYAAEGALKLKELTYRWAEHYPAGELKHGPLALVDNGTPVVVVDNGDPKLSANIAEIAARGGRIIRIGSLGSTIPAIQSIGSPWGPLESVVPMQILARTLGVVLGRDVDKPRNLAKSVTVE